MLVCSGCGAPLDPDEPDHAGVREGDSVGCPEDWNAVARAKQDGGAG